MHGWRERPRARAAGIVLAMAMACGQSSGPSANSISRVLFLGNSLTYSNDLPEMVRVLALAAGTRWDITAVVVPGVGLEDHFRSATVQRLLTEKHWDIVVLQQGPTTLASSRAHLRTWTAEFGALIERAGGRPALYEVWPDSNWSGARFLADFDRVRDSYALAAQDVAGIFLPAGEAWRMAWETDPRLPLYGGDSFHPSAMGTYLAALTIVGRLANRSVEGLPGSLRASDGRMLVQISAAQALALQKAADRAIQSFRDYEAVDQP